MLCGIKYSLLVEGAVYGKKLRLRAAKEERIGTIMLDLHVVFVLF